ncbi:hypothetical protein C9J48_05165 [Photobacterium profundum]|uniref:Fimbrial-type adhesion domain-containing protein n=1 Tax=Photobacterium profundum 3TCK TaxID=314280 RepID=Q1Z6V2_9GAMM|nr:fimbrial protein [Photobacterium profundum]EAS44351.1 hypothetical protein P3TCK_06447 [Photobacterium profundum 3TCK]PSV62901.1 hypothetical protein C9J48_05165 [Photobacterium profundum]
MKIVFISSLLTSLLFSAFTEAAIDEKPIYIKGALGTITCDTVIFVNGEEKEIINLGVISINDFTKESNIHGTPGSIVPGPANVDYTAFSLAPINAADCPATTAQISLKARNVEHFPNVIQSDATDETKVGVEVLMNDGTRVLNQSWVAADTNFDATTKAITLKANFYATTPTVTAGKVEATAVYQILYL